MSKRNQKLREKFQEKNLRFTKPREVIGKVLDAASNQLTAEEVYQAVHKKYPKIGLATVYRNLDVMEEMGLILKLNFGDGRHRYKIKQNISNPEHHHNLLCTSCKKVINYSDFEKEEKELLNKVHHVLAEKHNFEITGHLIQFYGICKSCN
jgi:Fur family ferric uptake transcriptional regulator